MAKYHENANREKAALVSDDFRIKDFPGECGTLQNDKAIIYLRRHDNPKSART